MKNYSITDFAKTGNKTFLGKYYADYHTVEVGHIETGALANILTDSEGYPIPAANNITDRIKAAFSLQERQSKIIPLMIDGERVLVLRFPEI